jgi:mRNA-degrading endonuclease YafQ of YafQ-DinJ toxin-antitoxin module
MRRLNTTNKFEKDVELAKRRGKDMAKIRTVLTCSSTAILYRVD